MSTFHQCLRQVISPKLPLSVRQSALVFALLKLSRLTYRGSVVDGDYAAFCRDQRSRLNHRFGFDGASPENPESLVDAVAFAHAEYNKLRQVERILYRRRVSQKMRGKRRVKSAEWQAAYDFWCQATERYRNSL